MFTTALIVVSCVYVLLGVSFNLLVLEFHSFALGNYQGSGESDHRPNGL